MERASPAIVPSVAITLAALGLALVTSGAARAGEQPAVGQIWKSQTTGYEYRVRIEGHTLSAEWVNVPPNLARQGAYIRTECRQVGSKWIGTSRSRLPCAIRTGGSGQASNWCSLVTRTEIDSLAADRITGRAQTLKHFDCAHCRILEAAWASFVWVRTERKASGGGR